MGANGLTFSYWSWGATSAHSVRSAYRGGVVERSETAVVIVHDNNKILVMVSEEVTIRLNYT